MHLFRKTLSIISFVACGSAIAADLVSVRPEIQQSILVLNVKNESGAVVTVDGIKLLRQIEAPAISKLAEVTPSLPIESGTTQPIKLASVVDVYRWLNSSEQAYPVMRSGESPQCPKDIGNAECLSRSIVMEISTRSGGLSSVTTRGFSVYLIRPR